MGCGRGEDPSLLFIRKTSRVARKGFSVPVGKINEILKSATKQNLNTIKGRWADIAHLEKMTVSHAALLKDAEPVAASEQAFVIKFKYEIHCQMAMDKMDEVSMVIGSLFWKKTAGCWCS